MPLKKETKPNLTDDSLLVKGAQKLISKLEACEVAAVENKVFLSNKKNLRPVIWYQVFLSNTNNF